MDSRIVCREKSDIFLHMNNSNSSSSSSNIRLDDYGNLFDEGKVKTRLLSMWNNMKYGMKLRTNFSKESPVWLLGKCYHKKLAPCLDTTELGTDAAAFQSQNDIPNNDEEGFEGFKSDFISRFWLTYRREFPTLNGSTFSSDCGWGCMLRSGQMLLAQALVCHILGRDWRWHADRQLITKENFIEILNHRKILKWFGDKPSRNSPFSIHALVQLGEACGKKAGDWYGPGFVSHLIRQAVTLASKDNYEFDSLNVYVAQDCAVYIKDVLEECTIKGDIETWKSLIMLIPVRLGTEKFNPIYAPCLTGILSLEQCIGIIGGRPKHSLYFVGYQDDKLIHLDPHYCQEMVDVWSIDFPVSSFHCRSPRKLHLSKMDPSCCIGFYCKTKEDFFNLIEILRTLVIPPGRSGHNNEYPMFVFFESHKSDFQLIPVRQLPPDIEYNIEEQDREYIEAEEFEIL